MPGRVTSLTIDEAAGWAIHPYLARYEVVVHLTFKTKILKSAVASLNSPEDLSKEHSGHHFLIDLTNSNLDRRDLSKLGFLIGESDEIVELDADLRSSIVRRIPATIALDDLIFSNAQRSWVNGATFIEAEQAGLPDSIIIDLLYRDYLGRPADPAGLAAYVMQVRQGSCSYADIRASFLASEEYASRALRVADAPGAIFSQGIAMLVSEINEQYMDQGS